MLGLLRNATSRAAVEVKSLVVANFRNPVRYVRYKRKKLWEQDSFEDYMKKVKHQDSDLYYHVDIGLALPNINTELDRKRELQYLLDRKNDEEFEKAASEMRLEVNVEAINQELLDTYGPKLLKTLFTHYGIYKDLFGEAYFHPVVEIRPKFADETNQCWHPVYYGNIIKPNMAIKPPQIDYKHFENTFWTLILTNPDGNFTEPEGEYVHWFIGNIPGNKVDDGDMIVPYLQPFPPRGIGYQRFIFILYKQSGKIDYSQLKKLAPCLNLPDRTFKTLDFYRRFQDEITPAGLSFFQSDWDKTLTDFYHNVLEMKEPCFEYDFPQPYIRPQEWFPTSKTHYGRPFNLYLDKYRDPKDIHKDFFLRKMKRTHPFRASPSPHPFPWGIGFEGYVPSWLKLEIRKSRMKWGRINDIEMQIP